MEDIKPEDKHTSAFREYLPDLSLPRFTAMREQDCREYAEAFKASRQPPWFYGLFLHWRRLFEEPYRGISTDGHIRDGLFELQDEDVPIEAIASAANAVLEAMSDDQRRRTCYHIDSPEWRSWSNPEFLLSDKGTRLDETTPKLRQDILRVLELTLSPEGYQKALAAMRINHFLGALMQAPKVMNVFSYNFALFGKPSVDSPWGFSFYGHHLCLNIFLYRRQIVISPWFTGAEPNFIDEGEYKGTYILKKEEELGLRLMQSLDLEQQRNAQVYKELKDPSMPLGRWNHDDQRHLCGAFRDNTTIPYEGILVSEMATAEQDLVLAIVNEYLLYLPEKSRMIRLEYIKKWLSETYWCWIGGFSDKDPFYYRIQSPVIIIEFDHHSGVFLNNAEPAKFHIHTLLRTPNRGDYGMALRPLIPGLQQEYQWQGNLDRANR
ncbi:Uncharacterized protein HZ326_25038 [Fusarium oxysporum f. sp. albedinis]|nr:hypothetical protein HZ326_25389 [Fusarium oxysporum f. sp. albedinis]KAJ0131875.1 Uncharacterized protein HZ326_25038 [Fusarium oxysporum f. sp. albedinis]